MAKRRSRNALISGNTGFAGGSQDQTAVRRRGRPPAQAATAGSPAAGNTARNIAGGAGTKTGRRGRPSTATAGSPSATGGGGTRIGGNLNPRQAEAMGIALRVIERLPQGEQNPVVQWIANHYHTCALPQSNIGT